MKQIEMLGTPMHVATMSETVEFIKRRVLAGQFTQHVVVNVAKIVNMRKNPMLRKGVAECDIINIDGMGVVWGARLLGHEVPERVAGVDLFLELIAMSADNDLPVFLLGAKSEIVNRTKENLEAIHPKLQVAGVHDGYFSEDEEEGVVRQIRESGARLMFVAITSPKKEIFINRWGSQLGVDFVMGVGGTFDVVSGMTKRAPVWMQNWGLEWLYRIIQEPRRMWKRYLVTNSKFAWLLLRAKLGMS
ncbi:MAG: WecB/TagA/CpsF family glycosyltransferase [Oceanospirillaceae bacterium]|nr:WecB/TagA/CpsF family glycosyltransferase [Oceanospirillaceae bacterium]